MPDLDAHDPDHCDCGGRLDPNGWCLDCDQPGPYTDEHGVDWAGPWPTEVAL